MDYKRSQGFLCLLCTEIKAGKIHGKREHPSSGRYSWVKTTGARWERS